MFQIMFVLHVINSLQIVLNVQVKQFVLHVKTINI